MLHTICRSLFAARRLTLLAALVLIPCALSCGLSRNSSASNLTEEAEEMALDPNGQGAAGGQLPRKSPPQGMLELPGGGSGRILTSRMSGTASARKMLLALRMGIDGYFDAAPNITAAFADEADQNLQAAFTAKLGGIPVRGVMAIQMRGDTGQATLVFDRWAAFPQTFAQLAQSAAQPAGGGEGRGAQAPVQLTTVPLPDGSGQIGLPPGWRVTNSYKGTVDAVGPNGEMLGLGGYVAVNSKMMGEMYSHIPKVDFNDPVRAALDYAAFQRQQVRIIDAKPVQMPTSGNWAFMRFQMLINNQPYDGLGLYGIMLVDQVQGILYMSYAVAPSQVFRQALPSMWASWQSWGINDSVFRERMTSAAASMRETGEILTGSYRNRQDTYARVNQAWSNYIRDESVWRDPSDPNTQYRIPNAILPADGNTGRLEPVPIRDLIP